jgi:tetratricopeptide (TPR) repeat protein
VIARGVLVLGAGLVLVSHLCAQEGAEALARAIENRLRRGDEFLRLKQYDAAIGEFEAALKLDARHAPAFFGRGRAKHYQGEYDGAVADYTRTLELDPDHGRALYNRALIRQWRADHEGAVADLSRALELHPNWAAAYVKRGDSRRQLVDYVGAAEDYARAVEFSPKNRAAYMSRAQVSEDMGDFHEAQNIYTALLEFEPDHAPAFRARGQVRALLGKKKGSEADFERALALAPKDIESLTVRARMRMLRGDHEAALADCKTAARIAPKNAHPYFIRGLVEYNFGQYKKARVALRKAVTRADYEPDYIQLYLCLAKLRLRMQARAVADLKTYYQAKQKDPEPWYAQVVGFLTGEIGEEEFLAAAKDETPKKTRERQCEAFFYAGTLRDVAGDVAGARKLFKQCLRTGVWNFIEYETSKVALRRS